MRDSEVLAHVDAGRFDLAGDFERDEKDPVIRRRVHHALAVLACDLPALVEFERHGYGRVWRELDDFTRGSLLCGCHIGFLSRVSSLRNFGVFDFTRHRDQRVGHRSCVGQFAEREALRLISLRPVRRARFGSRVPAARVPPAEDIGGPRVVHRYRLLAGDAAVRCAARFALRGNRFWQTSGQLVGLDFRGAGCAAAERGVGAVQNFHQVRCAERIAACITGKARAARAEQRTAFRAGLHFEDGVALNAVELHWNAVESGVAFGAGGGSELHCHVDIIAKRLANLL